MDYEKYYELNWTWHYVNSYYCYSEYKTFNTDKEASKFLLDLFHNPEIEIVWCEKKRVETWKNTLDKVNKMCYNKDTKKER
jgi:hypothetical protein